MNTGAGTMHSATPSWQKLARRIAFGGGAIGQEFSNLSTDMRLLLHRWKDGVAVRQKRLEGFEMVVRAEEEVGRAIYYGGVHESAESAFFRRVVREHSVCFDVGANVGYFSLLFASLAPQGAVHSFEPVPINYHLLCTNRLLNGFSNLTANAQAIGDLDGSVDFVVSADSAFSSLLDTGRKPVATRISVPITTLDSYCEENGISRIDVLKVDVEGAEARVLAGAARVLRGEKVRPHTVMLELFEPMLSRYGSGIDEVLEKMRCFGYRPFVFWKGQVIPFQREHYNSLYNVVFFHE